MIHASRVQCTRLAFFLPGRDCACGAVALQLGGNADVNSEQLLSASPTEGRQRFDTIRIDNRTGTAYKPVCWPLLSLKKFLPASPYVVTEL
jgi:hypothetical protein